MRNLNIVRGGELVPPNVPDGVLSYKNWIPPRINRESGRLEMHVPLGNYIGPGSDVIRRLAENVKPTTRADRAAQRHDIDYYNIRSGLRKTTLTHNQAREQVRQADNLLMKESRKGLTNITNPLNQMHSAAALSGIKAKTIGEDVGVVDPLLFVGKGKCKDPLAKMRKQMIRRH